MLQGVWFVFFTFLVYNVINFLCVSGRGLEVDRT